MGGQKRNTPYGYSTIDGDIRYNPVEAKEVQNIFRMYINGESFKSISDDLSARQVEYLPSQFYWNKNRVKRLLENEKYLGSNKIPPIISGFEFEEVKKIILSKTSDLKISDTIIFRSHIKCGKCGKNLVKSIFRNKTSWRCECKVSITLEVLTKEIEKLISRCKMLEYMELTNQVSTSTEIEYIQRIIDNELEQEHIDEDKIFSLIQTYSLVQYKSISNNYEDEVSKIKKVLADKSLSLYETIVGITKYLTIYSDHITATLITEKEI